MTDDLRCDLLTAAHFACTDILGGAYLLYYTHTDNPYEVDKIRTAIAKLIETFNAAYPES
jgi:hypothetical protein